MGEEDGRNPFPLSHPNLPSSGSNPSPSSRRRRPSGKFRRRKFWKAQLKAQLRGINAQEGSVLSGLGPAQQGRPKVRNRCRKKFPPASFPRFSMDYFSLFYGAPPTGFCLLWAGLNPEKTRHRIDPNSLRIPRPNFASFTSKIK